MTVDVVRPVLRSLGAGIFVGGTCNSDFRQPDGSYLYPEGYDSFRGGWKLRTMPAWGALARELGCWLHIARVNSARRIRLCHLAGANSFDGTCVTKFPIHAARLNEARLSPGLFVGGL